MICYVYRSRRRADAYLYLPCQDDFSAVPDALMQMFGMAEFALEFELTPVRRLAQADAEQVLGNLREQGFYLQMPPANERPF